MTPRQELDLMIQLELAGKRIILISEELHALTATQPHTGDSRPDHYLFSKSYLQEDRPLCGIIPEVGTREEYTEMLSRYGAEPVFISLRVRKDLRVRKERR